MGLGCPEWLGAIDLILYVVALKDMKKDRL